MNDMELTGLHADSPIGAMAAFGCLRICQRGEEFRGAKLGWRAADGSFVAVLRTEQHRSQEELVAALVADVKTAATRRELTWRKKLKALEPTEFREASEAILQHATARNRETADWFAAFGSDGALDRDDKIDATPLDMTGGPQEFLAGALELAGKLSAAPTGRRNAKTGEQAFHEALFGPWKYGDDQHSLGWDPTTIKLGAFTYKAPTKMANSGVMAAVWLAFESIPLFPCFAVHGRLQARSFSRKRSEFTLWWPVWREPISLERLSFLLGVDHDDTKLAARGVTAIYRSRRFNLNKYYSSFRVPELAFGGMAAYVE
jgi:hypothetical protein